MAVHVELNQRSSLAVGLSIPGDETLSFVGVQKNQFCASFVTQLLAYKVGDAKLGKSEEYGGQNPRRVTFALPAFLPHQVDASRRLFLTATRAVIYAIARTDATMLSQRCFNLFSLKSSYDVHPYPRSAWARQRRSAGEHPLFLGMHIPPHNPQSHNDESSRQGFFLDMYSRKSPAPGLDLQARRKPKTSNPTLSTIVGSAPALISIRATSKCPCQQATKSGVDPCLPPRISISMSFSFSRIRRTIFARPKDAA
ncbi:hypothetical protein KCU98_g73, partial [Aureobasidium melanogenum]